MSRHRNIRSMNYDEEYEGYDDVYGHSVEDDYCASPSASQYMYDRSKTQPVSSYFTPEEDIAEEPEESMDAETKKTRERLDSLTIDSAIAGLVPEEETLLKSCLEEIHNIVGDSIPESVIISNIIRSKFNVERALDDCLKGKAEPGDTQSTRSSKRDRDGETPSKELPKLDYTAKHIPFKINNLVNDIQTKNIAMEKLGLSDRMATASTRIKPTVVPLHTAINVKNSPDTASVSLLDTLAISHLEKVDKNLLLASSPKEGTSLSGSRSTEKALVNSLFVSKSVTTQSTNESKPASNMLFKTLKSTYTPPLKTLSSKSECYGGLVLLSNKESENGLMNAPKKEEPKGVEVIKNSLFSKSISLAKVEKQPLGSNSTKNLLFRPSSGQSQVSLFARKECDIQDSGRGLQQHLGASLVEQENASMQSKKPQTPTLRGNVQPPNSTKVIKYHQGSEIISKVDPRLAKRKPSFLGGRIAVPCDTQKKAKFFHYSNVWKILTTDCADRCFNFDTPSPDEQARFALLYNRPATGYQQPAVVPTATSAPARARQKTTVIDFSHHDC